MSKFGTKSSLFRIFGLEFEKNVFIFEISVFEFVLLQNFSKQKKTKMPKLETKNALFGYFRARI